MVRISEIIDIDDDINMEILKNTHLVNNIKRVYDIVVDLTDDLQKPPPDVYDKKTIIYIKNLLNKYLIESYNEYDRYYGRNSQCTRICKYLLNYF